MGTSKNIDLLIIGPGRGGTSLLAALLDTHPQFTVELELHSVACLMQPQSSIWPQPQHKIRVKRFLKMCRSSAASSQKTKYWGNKITTEQLKEIYGLNPEKGLDYFFGKLPKSTKVIFIMRDGRTCIPSKIKRGGKTLDEAISLYRFSDLVYEKSKPLKSRQTAVTYEGLLSKPQETLSDICDFLNIPFWGEMLAGTQNSKLLPEYRLHGIKAEKLDGITDEPWHGQILDLLKKWGYKKPTA